MSEVLRNVRIGLVKIPVTDFARACEFYRETLGLEEEFAVEEYAWAQYRTANVPLCLYVPGRGGGGGVVGGDTGVQLRVADARAAHEQLKAHVPEGVQEGDDGSVGFLLHDPDGNLLQVLEQQ